MATTGERLARLTGRATLYELAITDGERSYLVAYANRTGRAGLFNAVSDPRRVQKIVALTGTESITFGRRSADGATMGGWSIRFTGRTQREAIATETELPSVSDLP